ncbi:MAG: glycosyltransferase [Fimbriimonadaceae bacterium]
MVLAVISRMGRARLAAGRYSRDVLRVLVVSDLAPDPTRNSGDRRFVALLECLAGVARVALAMPTPGADEVAEARLAAAGVLVFPRAARWLDAALLAEPWDVCLIEFWHLAERCLPTVRRLSPGTIVVVDSVDVHFRRERAGVELGLFAADDVAERAAREIATYSAADLVIVVNEADREALLIAGVRTETAMVPNIVPLRGRTGEERPNVALFVGGFKHLPNEDAVVWFCDSIWPLVRERVPGCRLQIVGSHVTDRVLALAQRDGVEVVGYVLSTGPYLDGAAVSVAPLRYGGGMKGKVCEALAAGVPVVTTAVGADGLGLENWAHAVIADTASGFADGVVWAMLNQRAASEMGAAGRTRIAGVCSVEAVSARVKALAASARWQGRWTGGLRARWRARALAERAWRAIRPALGAAKRGAVAWLGGRS